MFHRYKSCINITNTNLKSYRKEFWSFIKSKTDSGRILGMIYNVSVLNKSQAIVDGFADHFSKSSTLNNAPPQI